MKSKIINILVSGASYRINDKLRVFRQDWTWWKRIVFFWMTPYKTYYIESLDYDYSTNTTDIALKE